MCTKNNQDASNYGFGWSQYNSAYSPPNEYQSMYEAFKFKDATTLQGSPMDGMFDSYDGAGYLFEMRGKLSFLQGNLSLLREMNWVDRQTRAVFVEFSVYNPNINLVMVSTILVEFLSSGSILTMAKFEPLNLFGESNGFSFKTLCEIVLAAFIIYYTIIEVREMINADLKEYLSEFWTYIEWSIITSAFISCIMILIRLKKAQEVLDFFKKTSGYGYIKLQKINDSNQTLTFSLGICTFLSTIKYLKMLRFNQNIAHLGMTLMYCFAELILCSMVFFVIWIAFVQLMFLIYGGDMMGYASLTKSMMSAFLTILGKFDAKQFLSLRYSFMGPLVFASYNMVILCFVVNIFISIITDSFDKVRRHAKKHPEDDIDLFKFVAEKWRRNFKKRTFGTKKKTVFTYENYIDHMESFHIQINRLIEYFARVMFCLNSSVFRLFKNNNYILFSFKNLGKLEKYTHEQTIKTEIKKIKLEQTKNAVR